MTKYLINGVDVTKNVSVDSDDKNAVDLPIEKTNAIEITKTSMCSTDSTKKNFIANKYPDLLGARSVISVNGNDGINLNSQIDGYELNGTKLTISYSNMIGGSIAPEDNTPLKNESDYNWPPIDRKTGKAKVGDYGKKVPMYTRMQAAWLICYTTLSGINYTYQPPDWTPYIINSNIKSTELDISDLISKYHPIIIYVVANNSFKLSGMPKKMMDVTGQSQNTDILNSSVFHSTSAMPNGDGSTCGTNKPNENGPDGSEQSLLMVEADKDDTFKIKRAGRLLQFRNLKNDPNNRIKINRISMGQDVDNNFPYSNGVKIKKDINTVTICDSSVVNYKLREAEARQGNICTNIVMGGYIRIAATKIEDDQKQGNYYEHPYFLPIAEIRPNVMMNLDEMNDITSKKEIYNPNIVYPVFQLKSQGSNIYQVYYDTSTISKDDFDFDYSTDYNKKTPTDWGNRQPKLTLLNIDSDNTVHGVSTQKFIQYCIAGDHGGGKIPIGTKLTIENVPVSGKTIKSVVVMNVNFIKVKYNWDGAGTKSYYVLFESRDTDDSNSTATRIQKSSVQYYQMYQNGTKWRIIYNNKNNTDKNDKKIATGVVNDNTWSLQKLEAVDKTNPFGNYDNYNIPAKSNSASWKPNGGDYTDFKWQMELESQPSTNAITPIQEVVTNTHTGSVLISYNSTTWDSSIKITQVGLMEEHKTSS